MGERDLRAVAVRYGPPVVLVVLLAVAIWIRLLPTDRVLTDARVIFSGTDAWYHRRMVGFAVRHFPATTPFDPWTNFPSGTGHHSGYGGLFDQLIAAGALIVGLGSPSERLVDLVVAVAPVLFGAATVVPTYVLARQLTDRWGGLVAAGILVIVGGSFLTRTLLGAADHQSAEPLFATLAVVGLVWAVDAADDKWPTGATIREWPVGTLRHPLVAGVATAAYLALWPPGVLIFVPLGAFAVVQLARDHVAGRPRTQIVVATAVPAAVVSVLTLTWAGSLSFAATRNSLLQPAVAFALVTGTVSLVVLARGFDRRDVDRRLFPVAIAGIVLLASVLAWLFVPRAMELLTSLLERVFSFGLLTSPTAESVAEVRPATLSEFVATFRGLLVLALVGLAVLVVGVWRENRPAWLLVLLWSLTTVAATLTMARFEPYSAVTVAVLGGVGARRLLGIVGSTGQGSVASIDSRHVALIALIAVLVVPGNVVGVGGQDPAWAETDAPWGTESSWLATLDWLRTNTPAEPLGYYHQFERPADGDFDYPPDAYGVVSRWDAGHWITTTGRRIPYANPFQEGTDATAAFFLVSDEDRAESVLAAFSVPSRGSTTPNASWRDRLEYAGSTAKDSTEDARYVIVDHEMATSGFPSMTDWVGPALDAYLQRERYRVGDRNVTLQSTNSRYDETMLVELYRDDASALGHYRLVHEVDSYAIVGSVLRSDRGRPLTSHPLDGDWNAVTGLAARLDSATVAGAVDRSGRGRFVAGDEDHVGEAVEIGPDAYAYDAAVESRVKVYERVPGATIAGTVAGVDAGTPAVATLPLQTADGRRFTYVRRTTVAADGSIRLAVAYSTDDAVDPAADGTNASVRATGPYHLRVGNESSPVLERSLSVPESAIYANETVWIDG